ncbi:MAG: LysR family transcriptional regulator [Bauldia sp.]|nr:LysR family transcriptional regulator [Bauldia sp.]
MDVELARTFLEIVSTGSFVRAAERLNVAQTTVSARVRTLEEKLGRPLFVRNKAGASLTPAGEQFLRHAPTFVQLWQRVRNVVAVPEGHQSVLTVGAETSLWQPLLLDWVVGMRKALPELALRAHVDVPWDLIDQVADGLVDAAVMYAPSHRPGLRIELLLDEKLVLVTSDPDAGTVDDPGFLTVDWGPEFAREFSSAFPDAGTSGLSFDFGPLALGYLLTAGGTGYFRSQAVKRYIESGELHLVPEAPKFSYPIYAVTSTDAEEALVAPALATLRQVISA